MRRTSYPIGTRWLDDNCTEFELTSIIGGGVKLYETRDSQDAGDPIVLSAAEWLNFLETRILRQVPR